MNTFEDAQEHKPDLTMVAMEEAFDAYPGCILLPQYSAVLNQTIARGKLINKLNQLEENPEPHFLYTALPIPDGTYRLRDEHQFIHKNYLMELIEVGKRSNDSHYVSYAHSQRQIDFSKALDGIGQEGKYVILTKTAHHLLVPQTPPQETIIYTHEPPMRIPRERTSYPSIERYVMSGKPLADMTDQEREKAYTQIGLFSGEKKIITAALTREKGFVKSYKQIAQETGKSVADARKILYELQERLKRFQ